MILDLPDIGDTRYGRELIAIGFKRGLQRVLLQLARRRFGETVDAEVEAAVRALDRHRCEMLLDEHFDLPDGEAFCERVAELGAPVA